MFAEANRRTSLVALIEIVEGVENADEIAAVDGVDCLWVGQLDLSCSLGIPGQFDHPDFVAAMKRVVEVARQRDKSVGRSVATVDEGVALHTLGFDCILYSADVWLLQTALARGLEDLRRECLR
jgi:2-keto-3-deoxy-L-rhamnonate aldolase RhmA